jgi:four helix bundle protein
MAVSEYRELRVYRGAFEAAALVFQATKRFPVEERYSLTDQIRRLSRSICANIAEAWRKRRYQAAFVSKLTDADAEVAETQVWLDVALACAYLHEEEHRTLLDRYTHIGAKLGRMIANPESWCTPNKNSTTDE